MPSESFLHRHSDFPDLLRIVGHELSIDPALVEKDFRLSDRATRQEYEKSYAGTRALYYKTQPSFDEILAKIEIYVSDL